jgi:PAS domain S-box-containing protein
MLKKLQEHGLVRNFDQKFRRKTGEVGNLLISAEIIELAGEQCLLGMVSDVTKYKKVENLLRTRLRLSELAQHCSLDELMQAALDEAELLTGSSIGFFHFFNPDQETLTLQAWSTNTLQVMCKAKGKGMHYPVSQAGVWADCIRTQKPVIHNDYASLTHKKGTPDGHAPVVRELTVPVLRRGSVVAVMGVGNKPQDYTQDDVETVQELASLVMDLVEGKRAEDALKESRERYSSLFENMLEGYAYCEMVFEHETPADFVYLEINNAFNSLTGLTNVVGKKVTEVIPGIRQTNPELFEIYGRVSRTGRPERFETYLPALGIWLSIAVYSPSRERFVTVFDNITERKEAEKALHDSERNYRTLVDNATVGVFRSTIDGRFLYVNEAMARIFECASPDEMLSEDVPTRYKSPKDRDELLRILKLQGKVGNYELEALTKSGKPVSVLVSAAFDNEIISGMLLDITEHKKLEEQFRQAQKIEAIGQLAGGVAHDFNNILTAIIGYSHMTMMKLQPNDPARLNLEQILVSANRATILTQSLLAFSRRQPISLDVIDLTIVIKEFEKFIHRLIREDIGLETICTEGVLPVMADKGQIEQVIMNLVTNARDAMPHGGKLLIETRNADIDRDFIEAHGFGQVGEYALISVSDTGIGMDEQTRSRIFEPFFTTKEPGKGTGLGLSMVYGTVKKHNGYINVYSEAGKGTTLKIYLPRVRSSVRSDQAKANDAIVRGGTETILVAEDDEMIRNLSVSVLKEAGYAVIEAVDGADAVSKFKENKDNVRLVVLDGIMPMMNGKEVLQAIRNIATNIKCIFMSGYSEDIFNKDGVSDEENGFIMKPVSPADLLIKIREVLDKQ